VPFSRAGYEPKHPKVLELNPKRQVPVLVDGDVAIYDSTIIFEYLEDRYPEPALYPRDPARKARCRVLEAAADEILFPPVWDLIREVFYKRKADPGKQRGRLVKAILRAFQKGQALQLSPDMDLGERDAVFVLTRGIEDAALLDRTSVRGEHDALDLEDRRAGLQRQCA